MARDRLAAMRAQQQGMYGGSNNSYPTQASGGYGQRSNQYNNLSDYEMSDVGGSRTYNAAPTPVGTPGDAMSAFYAEIASIQDSIRAFNENISRIGELHSRSLNNMDDVAAQQNSAALDDLVAETSALSATLKRRIKALEAQGASGRDGQIRRAQTGLVKSKFVEAIQTYQSVEQQYRTKHKQRLERQFKIVKPDATPEEVRAVVNNENNGQIFSQALMNSQFTNAQMAYREVQERHEDIKRIEKTLAELAQLFNDMSILVEQQDEVINTIETQAYNVQADTEAAYKHTEDAVKSAAAARKKRWICFFIILIVVLAIVGGVVGAIVSKQNTGSK
ncbi:syntaxin [Coprinopsis cinerea okayama7|uniref:Syntaxin n=1 Tax=Coprinopsis cinerea (strain Okayama-7 / 130 / ATCC MYA-4618 / FGSC 9003) TaxID=240176 RepID=A8NFP1_COPC7|nr:syntaxin [Coprinopsis cinerea okayama7\|eukprot:XP_001833336.2 syntaxin [Coprinopsis cinerea okayama7\